MRYTDDQLSRILGECDAGRLRRLGAYHWVDSRPGDGIACCVNQAAFNEPSPSAAEKTFRRGSDWFDDHGHIFSDSPVALLRSMEREGFA